MNTEKKPYFKTSEAASRCSDLMRDDVYSIHLYHE